MEREVGGGIGMGNTCKPMADLFRCMTKSTTIKKKKKIPEWYFSTFSNPYHCMLSHSSFDTYLPARETFVLFIF